MAVTSDVILSIRDLIPDPSTDGTAVTDGPAFSLATLLRWINDALRVMATAAPIVQDWYAVPSAQGMDVYALPSTILSIEQLWYDLWPCYRSPEYSALFVNKITSRSYFFGPHAVHSTPRLHIWPACDRTASQTSLAAAISATDGVISLASATGFKAFGFAMIGTEVLLYRTADTTAHTLSNVLRGQGGTTAAAHVAGTNVQELNIFFKASRLPTPLTASTDPIEVPNGLLPLIELYVLSKVREAEQDQQVAASLRKEFQEAIQALESRAPVPGLRQGLQVRTSLAAPLLFGGRVYVP